LALSIAANIVQIWGPFWPTELDFAPVALSFGHPFEVPFVVTNKSVVFGLSNLRLSCHLISFRAQNNVNHSVGSINNVRVSIVGPPAYFSPQGVASYTCPLNETINVVNSTVIDAKIEFISEYDFGMWWGKATSVSDTFTLNTHTVPHQWVRGVTLQ
jgi:hypothetical protein